MKADTIDWHQLESLLSVQHHPVNGNKVPIDVNPIVVEIFVVPTQYNVVHRPTQPLS